MPTAKLYELLDRYHELARGEVGEVEPDFRDERELEEAKAKGGTVTALLASVKRKDPEALGED